MSTQDRYISLDGNVITVEQWAEIVGDKVHVVIAEDPLPDGRLVRTMYFGTDFPLLDIRPFGTGLFTANGEFVVELGAYLKKDVALRSHAIHVQQMTDQLNSPDP